MLPVGDKVSQQNQQEKLRRAAVRAQHQQAVASPYLTVHSTWGRRDGALTLVAAGEPTRNWTSNAGTDLWLRLHQRTLSVMSRLDKLQYLRPIFSPLAW
jgi:hypothetical protein